MVHSASPVHVAPAETSVVNVYFGEHVRVTKFLKGSRCLLGLDLVSSVHLLDLDNLDAFVSLNYSGTPFKWHRI